jgi:hypothetical protein
MILDILILSLVNGKRLFCNSIDHLDCILNTNKELEQIEVKVILSRHYPFLDREELKTLSRCQSVRFEMS